MLRAARPLSRATACRRARLLHTAPSPSVSASAPLAAAARPHHHVHSNTCSHGHEHQHTHQHVPPPSPAPSSSSSSAAAASPSPSAAPSSSRPVPPVLAPGQMPPGDHPSLRGWYQRPLPNTLIPFASNRGKQLFKQAMNRGDCGPGTLAMVLNALNLDPKRLWKGNWRWFSEEMLETCDIRKPRDEPLAGVENEGLSFEEFLFLAECNGANVRAFRPDASSVNNPAALAKFRAAIHSATHRTDLHLVASFSRKVLGQTGSGHYSPIGGYHAELDLALVLDVARFKYPPYWAPVPMLWKAICEVDAATGQGRGYYLMSKGKVAPPLHSLHRTEARAVEEKGAGQQEKGATVKAASVFTPLSPACRIAVDKESWSRLAEHFCSVLPTQLQKLYEEGKLQPPVSDPSTATSSSSPTDSSSFHPLDAQCGEVLRAVLHSLPVELGSIFLMYTQDLNQRMIHAYKQGEKEKREKEAQEAQADVTLRPPPSPTSACSSTCTPHHPPLSLYHSFLPDNSPHLHGHSVPSAHALQPLLDAIAQTRLLSVLREANIDLHGLQSNHQHRRREEEAAAMETAQAWAEANGAPVALSATDVTATGSPAFHLLAGSIEGELELAALLLLACPKQVFSLLPLSLQSRLDELRRLDSLPLPLQTEVINLREQMGILADFCLCGAAPSVQGNNNPNVDPSDVLVNEKKNEEVQARGEFLAPSPPPQAPAQPAVPRVAHRFVTNARKRATMEQQR